MTNYSEDLQMTDEAFNNFFPFPSTRDGQQDIVMEVLEQYRNGKKAVVLCAPTAVGKSAIAVCLARYFGTAYILTGQKTLQNQYMNDFKNIGMQMIKGKYNYQCQMNPRLKCDMGVCTSTKMTGCSDCTYTRARESAYTSNLSVFNYTYFLNMVRTNYKHHIPRDFIVLDECHGVEGQLIDFMTVKLSIEDFKEHEVRGLVKFPKENLSEEAKFEWLYGPARSSIKTAFVYETSELEDMHMDDPNYYNQTRKVSYLDTLICMINRLEEQQHDSENDGVCIQNKTYDITFKPLKCSSYGEDFLHNYGRKILAMSATVFDKDQYCKDVGLNPETTAFVQCESPIPADRRLVYDLNAVSLSYKNKEKNKPMLAELVTDILDMHEGQRGIIHTVSYDIAKFLMETIVTDRFVMPRGATREETIDKFMKSGRDDLVLISPSLSEGISLDDNLSRFTVVCKLPYGNLGDPWIKKRMNISQRWYNNETIQSLVQMTGRSVRSKDDHAVSYILDSSFEWFYNSNGQRFPDWWKESLRKLT